MQRFLFVMRHAPHQGTALQERLDVILTTAAFDQAVSLLFLDDGVFQLKKHQQPEMFELKDTLAIFRVLELYDINDLYVEIESLDERGLQTTDLALPVKTVLRNQVAHLTRQFERVC
ncbi:MAG: sulfurtransferase complex subunit TusC [Methylococcaceae bacterium]|nr:sulfurtransferase complex subunit TusC [Methylococcaceae bacterium]